MRLFGAVVMIAGMVWLMVGCGGVVFPVAHKLVLADAGSGTHYELSVTDGALTMTGIGSSGTAETDAGLIDSVTGTSYQVEVAGGALMLEPGDSVGVKQIGLVDSATAKTYELAVAGGALTLIASDGAAQ